MRIRHQRHHIAGILALVKFVQLLNVQTTEAFPLAHNGNLAPCLKQVQHWKASHT